MYRHTHFRRIALAALAALTLLCLVLPSPVWAKDRSLVLQTSIFDDLFGLANVEALYFFTPEVAGGFMAGGGTVLNESISFYMPSVGY